jgi:hypothetical protein
MNRLNLVPTEFRNVRSGTVTKGYRAYDDNFCCYENLMETIPDDDLDFLEYVVDDVVLNSVNLNLKTALEHCLEHELGIEIDQEYYEFDEIKQILSKLNE